MRGRDGPHKRQRVAPSLLSLGLRAVRGRLLVEDRCDSGALMPVSGCGGLHERSGLAVEHIRPD